ncbi:MAG: SMP-30/gluconolactonase/LRE family protein [Actinomycetota bacterium]|nr:SMP-30/gluconolactonase/LRE family protein [Actinomycetota bacterium]
MTSPELLIGGLDFGEGPRWHDGLLWYSDFFQHRVYTVSTDGKRETVLDLGSEQPSGLGWLPNGDLLVVAMLKRQLVRYDGQKTSVHADLSDIATWHCNDMVVSDSGVAYVGNFGYDYGSDAEPKTADLAAVFPDGRKIVATTNLNFPNGSVITPDDKTLIVGETFSCRYSAFSILPDGKLSEGRLWAEMPGRLPDGCTLDSENGIWFADAFSTQVVRVVEGGEITDVIDLPQRTFACMLGGDDGKTLFILTASSDPESGIEPGAGAIYTVQVEFSRSGKP